MQVSEVAVTVKNEIVFMGVSQDYSMYQKINTVILANSFMKI